MKLPKLNVRSSASINLLWLLATFVVGGCATLYGQNNREITVHSMPEGAKLYMNGVEYGKTPTSIVLPSVGYSSQKLTLKKTGYKDQDFLVETEFQNVGYWNLIIPPAFLIDLGTGYMYKIKPGYYDFNIQLESNAYFESAVK
jgi:hypothetical protein